VASDVLAVGAMAAINERGLRIPQDMALVGYDDVPFARYLNPPLTTVRLPATELGARAAEMLVQLIHHETLPETDVRLEAHLVVRASCGAQTATPRP